MYTFRLTPHLLGPSQYIVLYVAQYVLFMQNPLERGRVAGRERSRRIDRAQVTNRATRLGEIHSEGPILLTAKLTP